MEPLELANAFRRECHQRRRDPDTARESSVLSKESSRGKNADEDMLKVISWRPSKQRGE
jgi:hypothetical protein